MTTSFITRFFRSLLTLLLGTIVCWSIGLLNPTTPAWAASSAASPLTQPAMEIAISLGNSDNELKFVPNHLNFIAGRRYKLLLSNPSSVKHYFTAKDFADIIWTQKVEAGKVEIKGAIHELELKPGAQAEWSFLAIKPGEYELHCSVAGHAEAGMTGVISVAAGQKT